MQYLFFDIECANPKFNSICTYGYVLTDENFNLIEQHDILMNPETVFDKYVAENLLHYSVDELCSNMPFPCFYDKIFSLMCRKDVKVLGFSLNNDLRFLDATCIRYKLPCMNFSFYDVQKMFGEYVALQNQASIEKAGDKLNIEKPMFIHRSDEDARITMEIARAMCKSLEISLNELIQLCPSCSGSNINFIEKWDAEQVKPPLNHKAVIRKKKREHYNRLHKIVN